MTPHYGFFVVFVLFFSSFAPANADLKGIEPAELEEMSERGVPVIDVRTPKEWKETGMIPASLRLTFFQENGEYDAQQWLANLKEVVPNPDQKFVLVRRSGNRTGMIGRFLSDQAGFKEVVHLQNGILSWIQENRPIAR